MLPAALQPYAKAVVPAVATLIGVGIQWAVTGDLNRPELVTALTGLSAAVLAFLVPNTPKSDQRAP